MDQITQQASPATLFAYPAPDVDCSYIAGLLFPGATPEAAAQRTAWLQAIPTYVAAFNSNAANLPAAAQVAGPSYVAAERNAAGLLTTRNTRFDPSRRIVNRVTYVYDATGAAAARRGTMSFPGAILSAAMHHHGGEAADFLRAAIERQPNAPKPHYFITVGSSFRSPAYMDAARELRARGVVHPGVQLPTDNTSRFVSQGAVINSYYVKNGGCGRSGCIAAFFFFPLSF